MWNRTRFLSRLLGLYLLIAVLMMVLYRQATVEVVVGLLQAGPSLFLLGLVTVGAGLAMILGHNVWAGGALPVVVTVIGWLTLLKGLLFWLLPSSATAELFLRQLHYQELYYLYAGLSALLGLYLCYQGFQASTRAA